MELFQHLPFDLHTLMLRHFLILHHILLTFLRPISICASLEKNNYFLSDTYLERLQYQPTKVQVSYEIMLTPINANSILTLLIRERLFPISYMLYIHTDKKADVCKFPIMSMVLSMCS